MEKIPILTCSAGDYLRSIGANLNEYELVSIRAETQDYHQLEKLLESEAYNKKCKAITDRKTIEIIPPETKNGEEYSTYIINATGLRIKKTAVMDNFQ